MKITKEFLGFELRGLIQYTVHQNKRALERIGRNAALLYNFYTEDLGKIIYKQDHASKRSS